MRPTTPAERGEISQKLLGKSGIFSAYFRLYDDLASRDYSFSYHHLPTPRTHQDVLYTAELLRSNIQSTKEEATVHLHNDRTATGNVDNIINMAVQAMIMIDSAARDWHTADFVLGEYQPISWEPQESFASFVERSFPISRQPACTDSTNAIAHKSKLKAWKLQKRLGLRFLATDNLSEHLLLNPKKNTLYLFHQVAYLKAHLERFQDDTRPLEMTTKQSLPHGTLPPQLLFETLHSLQAILFPLMDRESGKILSDLVRNNDFDPECFDYEGIPIEPPEGIKYVYWGKRIAQLHELAMHRPPRNKLERWFQQRSTDGNAFLTALLALFISILVGIVTILLGCFQAWIAWMAWKHPTQGGP
ncbi:hypothetical protein FDECE_1050 [Fusarium decemcellulare]|nr:hypothetical protein FDECE_1050 [Fusarium decemcellulare]